jgi:CheY-like chemotaxis protein
VLVVDDHRDGAEAICLLLSITGYESAYVLNGAEVLSAVATRAPDIAIVDINMPGIDGFAVAQQLRRDPRTRHTVIIAFTARDELDVREPGIAAGFDGYCLKGSDPASLLDLLNAITR